MIGLVPKSTLKHHCMNGLSNDCRLSSLDGGDRYAGCAAKPPVGFSDGLFTLMIRPARFYVLAGACGLDLYFVPVLRCGLCPKLSVDWEGILAISSTMVKHGLGNWLGK